MWKTLAVSDCIASPDPKPGVGNQSVNARSKETHWHSPAFPIINCSPRDRPSWTLYRQGFPPTPYGHWRKCGSSTETVNNITKWKRMPGHEVAAGFHVRQEGVFHTNMCFSSFQQRAVGFCKTFLPLLHLAWSSTYPIKRRLENWPLSQEMGEWWLEEGTLWD